MLLSAVLEKVMDKPFHEYIHDFCRLMGLTQTRAEPTPLSREIVPGRMPCYMFDYKNQKLTLPPEVTMMHKTAGGGLISTLDDLCLLGKRIADTFANREMFLPGVSREIFEQVLKPPIAVKVPNKNYFNYSLGFYVYQDDPSLPKGRITTQKSTCTQPILNFYLV